MNFHEADYHPYRRYSDGYTRVKSPSTLDRYETITGHRNPIPLSQLSQTVGKDNYNKAWYSLSILAQKIPHLLDAGIPPDVFMFEYDRAKSKSELDERFGWKGITILQTAHLLSQLSPETSLDSQYQTIQDKLTADYPSLQPIFSRKKHFYQEFHIPPDYFLDAIDQLIPYKERLAIQNAIIKYHLTPTEYAILIQLTRGKTNKEINEALSKPYHTIKNHIADILAKLRHYGNNPNITSRTDIAIIALEAGLFPHYLVSTLPEFEKVDNLNDLSARECEVMALVAKGLANKEIAGNMGISQQTVHHHITSILKKLECTDRTAATLVYLLDVIQRNEIPQIGGESKVVIFEGED